MAKRKSELDEAAQRAFGAENRARLLERWFASRPPVELDRAWEEVYQLLLWVDSTTGLAHCYESDKAQPGRPWYARSLAFHVWLSDRFGVEPVELVDRLDWLFRQAVRDLAAQQREGLSEKARAQREPFAGRDLPEPGADPELAEIIEEELGGWLRDPPPEEVWTRVVTRVQAYLSQENKRRNLTGEGFEDVVVALVNRLGADRGVHARTQVRLGDLDGSTPRAREIRRSSSTSSSRTAEPALARLSRPSGVSDPTARSSSDPTSRRTPGSSPTIARSGTSW